MKRVSIQMVDNTVSSEWWKTIIHHFLRVGDNFELRCWEEETQEILQAEHMAVEITYQSFDKDMQHTFVIHPYCVKIFKQRWYLAAFNPYYGKVMIYSLDRMLGARITDEQFAYPEDFSPKEFFRFSFGIIVAEDCPAEEVVLKVFREGILNYHGIFLNQKTMRTNPLLLK